MAKKSTKESTGSGYIDLTETGPLSYRQLQSLNNNLPDLQEGQTDYSAGNPFAGMGQIHEIETPNTDQGFGSSFWDNPNMVTEGEFQNYQDYRADNQPGAIQLFNGITKGVILAGTTFLDGTLGLLYGLGTAATEGRWSGIWDNDFSRAMQSINEASEEFLPNYYTSAQQNAPWYSPENLFTANFIGDKFIKNLGFTIGAFYGGGLEAGLVREAGKLATGARMAKAMKAGKTADVINDIARKGLNVTKNVAAGTGTVLSAVNEGRIEALNNSKDWYELQKAQLEDSMKGRLAAIQAEYEANAGKVLAVGVDGTTAVDPAYTKYQAAMQKERENYEKALVRLNEDRLKMGNADLLMNLPVLWASNIVQFGKMYANGFKTARSGLNIIGKPGEYMSGSTKLGNAWSITKGAVSEGLEEISQKAASVSSGNYYTEDMNSFYKALKDGKAEEGNLDWIKSIAQGINETINDGSSWEEFFIGTLTGALGMPSFRSTKSKTGGWQSPITIGGGAWNEWNEYSAKQSRENEVANYMNQRVQSPEFLNYYQGMIRHSKYQNDMNQAAEENNEFDFKNAEHAQLVSDINMFDEAGRLGDLQEMINAAFDTSDANLESIIKNTTSRQEDGTLVGPFANYAATGENGEIVASFGSEANKQDMVDKLTQNKEDFDKTIQAYRTAKDEIIREAEGKRDGANLSELIWMRTQIENWTDRGEQMAGTIQPMLTKVVQQLDAIRDFNQRVRDYEGTHHADLTDRYKQADKNVRTLEHNIEILRMLRDADKKSMTSILSKNPELINSILKEIDTVDSDLMSDSEKEDFTKKLKDLQKLGNAVKTYSQKFNEYMKNPEAQEADHIAADTQATQNHQRQQASNTAQHVLETSTPDLVSEMEFGEFDDSFLSSLEANESIPENVVQEIKDKLKNVKDIKQAKQDLHRRVDASDMTPSQKKAAHQMIDNSASSADNINDLLNTDGEAFFGTEGTLELSPEEQAQMQQMMQTDPQGAQDILSEMMAQNDEFARQELKELFEAYTNEKGEMEQLTTPDEELAAAMGNASQEELEEALAANGESKETGADPTERLTPVNPQPTTPSTSKVADKTTESDGKPNSEQEELTIEQENTIEFINNEEDSNSNQSLPKGNGGQNLYWKTNTTQELTARGRKILGLITGDHTAYHNSPLDTNNTLHSAIWNYLNSKGAFSRINNGEVGTNSVVRIGYSKALNEAANTMVPLLFIKDSATESWVVVGDMVSLADGNLAQTFPNYSVITDALNKATTEQGDNVLTDLETHVQSVLLGRPNYSSLNDRRSLNEIADGQEFKLAIATKTPGVIIVDSKKIKNPRTATENKVKAPVQQSPGQPFILVGDATNGYMCVPIRMPKFNLAEADNSAIGREVKRVAEDLNKLEDMSMDEILLLKNDLQALLNFEHLWINESKDGNHWVINYRLPNLPDVYLKYTKDQNVASQFLTQISNKAGYQVDTSRMNNSNRTIQGVPYNNAIGEIATTNLEKGGLHLVNNGLILNYLDANGKEITATRPQGATKTKSAEALKAEATMQIIEGQQSPDKLIRPTTDNNYYTINGVKYERVHNVMSDNSVGTMSQQGTLNGIRAKAAGTEVDRIVREFFNAVKDVNYTGDDTKYTNAVKAAVKAAKISSNSALVSGEATNSILNQLVPLALHFAKNNETVYANNLVIGSELNGVKVAGEIDILTVDDKGNFRIYDMKTSKNSFDKSNYDNPKFYQKHSDRVEHTTQLNFYKRILENEYGAKVVDLNIIPLFVEFQNGLNAKADGSVDPVTKITKLPFIQLDINSDLVNNATQSYKSKGTPKVDLNQNDYSNQPVSNEGKSLVRQQTIDNLADKSFITDYDENRDLIENLTDEQITTLSETRVGPKAKKSWAAFVNSIDRSKALDAKQIQESFDNSFGKSKPKAELNEEQKEVEEAIKTGKEVAKFSEISEKNQHEKVWDEKSRDRELRRIAKILPGLSQAERVKIVGTIEEVAGKDNPKAWGSYLSGVITLYKNAVAGTAYHEAFHNVVDTILNDSERDNMFTLAREEWGDNHTLLDLEERLAEGFKEYSLLRDDASFGQKLKNFFSDLWTDIKHWFGARDSLTSMYSRVYRGKYASRKEISYSGMSKYSEVSDSYIKDKLSRMSYYDRLAQDFNNTKYSKTRRLSEIGKMNDAVAKNIFEGLDIRPYHLNSKGLIEKYSDDAIIKAFRNRETNIPKFSLVESSTQETLRQDMQRFLDNFDIKIQEVEEFGGETKLFNALERTINIRNAEDITEGVGEAIAFMMQHSPMMKELITLRLVTEDPVTAKGFRRALKTKGKYDLKDKVRQRQLNDIYKNSEAKNRYLKDIGQDIAFELRRFYNLEERDNTSDSSDTFLSRVWEVIISFFNKLTPSFKTTIDIISNNTNQIANAAILNDPSIIVSSLSKPGSKSPTTRVDIGQALNENPYEDSIIKTLGNYNIALAGSTSIALEGTLFRPKENPLHDIDFNAKGHTKETLDEMFRKEYPNHSHIRTIKDGENKATETYLIMDEPFTINESDRFFIDEKKNKSYRIYEIVSSNGELLGEYYNSELSVFKKGIKGKFLDFFTGEDSSPYPNKVMNINGNPYLISDYRNAFQAKVDWARDKDVWDYGRFVSNDRSNQLNTLNAKKSMTLKEKVQEATVIWGHPAIGKTTYLESHDDILEWDELVNPKRNEFIRNQVDPNHELDTKSPEFKQLRSEYMNTWREHPEYVKFLTDEWNNLVARAKRENKRLFASPAPLLEIGINDFDLIVALPNRVFNERNMQRGGTELGSRGWKQIIDRMLVNIDPNKVVYTDDYFSDFMTKNLGSFSNLSGAQVRALKERGFTEESWSRLKDNQKEYTLECLGVTM